MGSWSYGLIHQANSFIFGLWQAHQHTNGQADNLHRRQDSMKIPTPGCGADAKESIMIESHLDDRTANNAVRHAYRVLTDEEKQQIVDLKDIGAAFIAKCQLIGGGRELALAITKAEEAVMWAVKHVTK